MKKGTLLTVLVLLIVGGVATREVLARLNTNQYSIRASELESSLALAGEGTVLGTSTQPTSSWKPGIRASEGRTEVVRQRLLSGVIKSVSDESLVLTVRRDDYVVNVSSATRFYNRTWGRMHFSSMQAGDRLEVYGPLSGTVMTARIARNISVGNGGREVTATLPASSDSGTTTPLQIRLSMPNGGETWEMGSTQGVGWVITAPNGELPVGAVLVFRLKGPTPARIFTMANPATAGDRSIIVPSGSVIVGDVGMTMKTGSYKVGAYLYDRDPCEGLCAPNIPAARLLAQDESDATFTIVGVTRPVIGDLNGDGAVTLVDVELLNRYVSGNGTLSEAALANAKIDTNSVVDKADLILLRKVVVRALSAEDLPLRWGDVNVDGEVDVTDVVLANRITEGLSTTVSAKGRVAADVDMNGRVTRADSNLIAAQSIGVLVLPAVYGDVNGDYTVSLADMVLLGRFVDGSRTPSATERFLGDVYKDNLLNADDTATLRKFILGTITSLPVTPISVDTSN